MGRHTVYFDLVGPLHVQALLGWLNTRAIPGLELISDTTYTRTLRLKTGSGVCSLSVVGERVRAELFVEHDIDLNEGIRIARRLFGVDGGIDGGINGEIDMNAVDALISRDPRLTQSIQARPGVRIPGLPNLTESVTRAILGQQITVAQARNQVETLVHELGDPLPESLAKEHPELSVVFPRAERLSTDAAALIRGPNARKATLARVTGLIASGELREDGGSSAETLIEHLQAVKGIGPWTAGYVALRLLGAPDIFLSGDVAMIAGGRALGLGDTKVDIAQVAESFMPYRSFLMMHLWHQQ